jgi:GNAT superfamily N-acetyltransferase
MRPIEFHIDTSCLRLSAEEMPWDSAIFGARVVQIKNIEVLDDTGAIADFTHYAKWIKAEQIRIVSCRLAHDRLRDSIFLESHDFRFIEMVLHPRLDNLKNHNFPRDDLLVIPAEEADMDELQSIAERAFSFERFHIEPRLSSQFGDLRYGSWVRNCLNHLSQRLLKILDGERLIGLFVIEIRSDQSAYWHLTAIAPEWQGQGYGSRVWLKMLAYCKAQGAYSVSTTISARNTPVLNLYSHLQFRFMPPEMTFHWIRDCE